MGVYISGMKKPETCMDCDLAYLDDDYGYICPISGCRESIESCLLMDVPDINVGDLISRQAAIDALCDNCNTPQAKCAMYPCDQFNGIEKLPSAQPEKAQLSEEGTTSDCISRQAAIDALDKDPMGGLNYNRILNNILNNLTGKWIKDEFGSRCSNCGLYAYRDKFDRPWESDFCPICGARMVKDETD